MTLIEPGPFGTDWSVSSAARSTPLPEYDGVRERVLAERAARVSATSADPAATADAIFAVVDAEEPPLRLFLGADPFRLAAADYGSRLQTWAQWQPVAASAQG